MTEYHFNVELAQRHGVNGAIFLHAMAFWVAKNQANGRHFHKGRTWTYNSLEALTKLFPFWTRRQLERIIAKLKEEGALLTGNFSEDKTDRTVWYALPDPVLEVYGLLLPPISQDGDIVSCLAGCTIRNLPIRFRWTATGPKTASTLDIGSVASTYILMPWLRPIWTTGRAVFWR